MKKVLSLFLAVLMLAGMVTFAIPAVAVDFDGTYPPLSEQLLDTGVTDYYIEDADDYKTFMAHLAKGAGSSIPSTGNTAPWDASGTGAFAGKRVYLAKNIYLNEGTGFDADDSDNYTKNGGFKMAEANAIKGFGGTFDGQGFTVSGVCIVGTAASHGSLFGYALGNATVKNVTFANCYIQTANPALAGLFSTATTGSSVNIENVRLAEDFVLFTTRTGTGSSTGFGGLVGSVANATLNIRNSVFEGIMSTNKTQNLGGTGGLVGTIYSKTADATVTIDNSGFLGTLAWNTGSSAISKFVGRVESVAANMTATLNFNNCIIGGDSGDSKITYIAVGMAYATNATAHVQINGTNSVWTKQGDKNSCPGSAYSGSTGTYNLKLKTCGFIPEGLSFVGADAFLEGDVVNGSAVSQGTADLTPYWVATETNPMPKTLAEGALTGSMHYDYLMGETDLYIKTAEDYLYFFNNKNNFTSEYTIHLANDIDLNPNWDVSYNDDGSVNTEGVDITLETTDDSTFKGTFDGHGYTVSGAYAKGNVANNAAAVIGRANGATIKNVRFEDCAVESSVARAAGLVTVATNEVRIENVYADIDVLCTGAGTADDETRLSVGGFVGTTANTKATQLYLDNCVYAGTLSVPSENAMYGYGGLVGVVWCRSNAYINACGFFGTIKAGATSHVAAKGVGAIVAHQNDDDAKAGTTATSDATELHVTNSIFAGTMEGCGGDSKVRSGSKYVVGRRNNTAARSQIIFSAYNNVFTTAPDASAAGKTLTAWQGSGSTGDFEGAVNVTTFDNNSYLSSAAGYESTGKDATLNGSGVNAAGKELNSSGIGPFDLTHYWTKTDGNPKPTAMDEYDKTKVETVPEAEYLGYQVKKVDDGYDIRFLALGTTTDFTKVGMRVTVVTTSGEKQSKKAETGYVYSGVIVGEAGDEYKDYVAPDGKYVYTLAGGPLTETQGVVSICITLYYKTAEDGVCIPSHTKTITINTSTLAELAGVESSILTLANNGSTDYKLYSTLGDTETATFQTAFEESTGATLSKTNTIGDKTIVLGTDATLATDAGITRTYSSYQVKVVDEKIYVAVATNDQSTLTTDAANALFGATVNASNKCLLDKTFYTIGDVTGIEEIVPLFNTSTVTPYDSLNNGKTSRQVSYSKVTSAQMDTYAKELTNLGYTLHESHTINGNRFATYTNAKKNMTVHLNWFATEKIFRISYGTVEYLPATQAVTGHSEIMTPKLTMMKLVDGKPGGLSMVAQLEDGSFIIIDGGKLDDDKENMATLLAFLNTNKKEEKPHVTWIFTHNHNDHVGNATKFLSTKDYGDKIQLDLVIMNFPNFDTLTCPDEFSTTTDPDTGKVTTEQDKRDAANKRANDLIKAIYKYNPNAKIYVPHAGDQLFFPGLEIEIYYTHEEMCNKTLTYLNDTSLVFKMKFDTGKTCMVFADSENQSSSYGLTLYGNTLKSNIMQVPHHGAGSASWELYSAVNPSICLWSVESTKFFNDGRMLGTNSGMDYNAKLRNDKYGERDHYHHSEIVTIDMKELTRLTESAS